MFLFAGVISSAHPKEHGVSDLHEDTCTSVLPSRSRFMPTSPNHDTSLGFMDVAHPVDPVTDEKKTARVRLGVGVVVSPGSPGPVAGALKSVPTAARLTRRPGSES
jgi:hypothetical protein